MRNWLRNERLKSGLTQEQVALASGISQQAIQKYEKGKRSPSVDVAKRIANTLGFDWTKFFEENTQ